MRLIYLTIIIFSLAACSAHKQDADAAPEQEAELITLTDEQVKNADIRVGVIEKKLLNSELKVNGLIDVPPQNIVSVSFPPGGYLKTTRLLPGMHVDKGEVIALMEDQALVQLQQDYLIAKAKLQYLEKEFERQKLLHENNVNADKVFQQAQADFTSQQVLVRGYAEKLRLIRIQPEKLNENTISRTVPVYSPINGFVSKVNVNIGKYVNPSEVLFELINPDDMHATLTVFEKDLSKIKPKQKVFVSFVDEPTVEYECEVLLVTKNVDDDRSALVHCHFEKQPERLVPGMFLNARIKVSDNEAPAVPDEAVVRYGNNQYILAAEGKNTFRLLQVETGVRDAGMTELISKETVLTGKNIIVKNPYPVLSALKNTAEEE